MLDSTHDAPRDHGEWRALLRASSFGQLIAVDGARCPVIVPLHFTFDGESVIEAHLHRRNPLWEALRGDPRGCLSVVAAHVFIPGYWNADAHEPTEWGAPTSYYAAVQVSGPVEIIDDATALAALLTRQMRHLQPEGRSGAITPGSPYGKMLPGILGLRLSIETVRAKFKFGGNRAPAHRLKIAAHLERRGASLDLEARAHLLRRLAAQARE